MLKYFSLFIIKIIGWKNESLIEIDDKCILIAGPHTSMWDFIMAWLFFNSNGVNSSFLIKKEAFFFPIGYLVKAMGGIPVDRRHGNNMVEIVARKFRESRKLHLIITPEGTRKKVKNWKKGFLYIAKRADVPIYIGYINYEKKAIGFFERFEPTGDVKADMKYVQNLYRDAKPKHPERFSMGD